MQPFKRMGGVDLPCVNTTLLPCTLWNVESEWSGSFMSVLNDKSRSLESHLVCVRSALVLLILTGLGTAVL